VAHALPAPGPVRVRWQKLHRIVASRHPPVDIFADLVAPAQRELAWFLEGLTNDRLREQAGETGLVAARDRVSGPGASVVLAAFTHIGRPTRFSDGSYGVYYGARSLETAVRETVYHRERFLRATAEAAGEIDMRVYIGRPLKPMHDLRAPVFAPLHDADDYRPSQAFARPWRAQGAWGFVYRSVRHAGGQCIAAFRPPAVSIPVQGPHLAYVWTGERIDTVYEKSEPLFR